MARLRTRIGVAVGVVLALGGTATGAGAIGLSTAPASRVSVPYEAHRVLRSTVLDRCVTAAVTGTLTGTRRTWGPLVRWTHVRLVDPTMSAANTALVAGRCGTGEPERLSVQLAQTWSAAGAAPDTRRTRVGPASGTVSQFNSGAPIDVPDRTALAAPGDLAVHGEYSVVASSSTTEDGVHASLDVVLPAARG